MGSMIYTFVHILYYVRHGTCMWWIVAFHVMGMCLEKNVSFVGIDYKRTLQDA